MSSWCPAATPHRQQEDEETSKQQAEPRTTTTPKSSARAARGPRTSSQSVVLPAPTVAVDEEAGRVVEAGVADIGLAG